MTRPFLFALAIVWASPAAAYEIVSCGWWLSGYDAEGCPTGSQQSDACGCEAFGAPRWPGGQLTLHVEAQALGDLSAAQLHAVAQEAAAAWSGVSCSGLVIDASQTFPASDLVDLQDPSVHGIHVVRTAQEWRQLIGTDHQGALSITFPLYLGDTCSERAFVDADILLPGFLASGWTEDLLRRTLLHALGTAIGLGNSCLRGELTGACAGECQSVMSVERSSFDNLQPDDERGVCDLYPLDPGGLGAPCRDAGDCASAPICVDHDGARYCTHSCGSCEAGYACRLHDGQDLCLRGVLPAIGEPCVALCEAGALCLYDGAGGGTCFPECDPVNDDCGADRHCVALPGGGGVCWQNGTLQVGERCGDAVDCAPGLACILDTADSAHCYLKCAPAVEGACPTTQGCVTLDLPLGICLDAAGPGEDCLATDGLCQSGLICTPDTIAAGGTESCRPSCDFAAGGDCPQGTQCQRVVRPGLDDQLACFEVGSQIRGQSCVGHDDCATLMACAPTPADSATCLPTCGGGLDCLGDDQCVHYPGSAYGYCVPGPEPPEDGGVGADGGDAQDAGHPVDSAGDLDAASPPDAGALHDAPAPADDAASSDALAAADAPADSGGPQPDAATADAPGLDAQVDDSGLTATEPSPGCHCRSGAQPGSIAATLILASLLVARRRFY